MLFMQLPTFPRLIILSCFLFFLRVSINPDLSPTKPDSPTRAKEIDPAEELRTKQVAFLVAVSEGRAR
jgi:hypothetical protein